MNHNNDEYISFSRLKKAGKVHTGKAMNSKNEKQRENKDWPFLALITCIVQFVLEAARD